MSAVWTIVGVNRWDEKASLRRVLEAQIKRRPAMKKVSTAAAKQSRKISEQNLTVGLGPGRSLELVLRAG